MPDQAIISRRMREHYEGVWRGENPWELETCEFERARYERQIELLSDRQYERVLEIGCGSGEFTRRLADVAERVVAIDIAEPAISRARSKLSESQRERVEFVAADAMAFDPEQDDPWNLIVLSETIYCLGWLYPAFDVGWFALRLFTATRPGGRLLLTNALGGPSDWLLQPWLVRTYRDLFVNVGYRVASEELLRGPPERGKLDVLITMFERSPARESGFQKERP
jgi:SAM-dependent methyltransferase